MVLGVETRASHVHLPHLLSAGYRLGSARRLVKEWGCVLYRWEISVLILA